MVGHGETEVYREFKLEAVRPIKDRGVSYVQASQDLRVHTSQLRDLAGGWLCEALGVSRGGFYAWLTRPRAASAAGVTKGLA
jgi:hypothetical protein